MRFALLIAAVLLAGCGSEPEKKAAVPVAPPPVKDNTSMLPAPNRMAARVVPDHLLGKAALPGGTIGDYEAGGKKYQLFVIETPSAQDAAILLLDLKTTLTDPAFVASFGGYFGSDGSTPVFAFAKGMFLAGVVGLPKDAADPIARELAVRLK
jgi:hypothetical protein